MILANSMKFKILLVSMIFFLLGIFGYVVFWDQGIRYIFAHIGALGIIGLFSWQAATLAAKKSLHEKRAVLLGFILPIILGITAVYLVDPPEKGIIPSSCGGIVSLGIASIVVIIYLVKKPTKDKER
jgi:hypothetical protein